MYYCGSDRNNDPDPREKRRDHKDVALAASTGGVGPLPIITTLFADPISVVSTTIDVSEFKDPSILLNFTSILSLPLGISVTLNFQINRSKDDGSSVKVGGTYTFSTLVEILESQSFGFQFADIGVAPGSYTYSIELSTNSVIDITPGLTILNATLSALAVDKD